MESPMNTTRRSNFVGAGTPALASAYRARSGQSCKILSVLSSFAASDGRSAQSGEALLGAFSGACAWAAAATKIAAIAPCTFLPKFLMESPHRLSLQETPIPLKQAA